MTQEYTTNEPSASANGRVPLHLIVGAFTELEESLGTGWWEGTCPLCDDQDESFKVYPNSSIDEEVFHCDRCGESGDVVAFFKLCYSGAPREGQALTDLGNSERLIAHHGGDLRYCHPWGKWAIWNGVRWEVDASGGVERRAVEAVRGIYAEAENADDKDERKALARHATASESRSRIEAMIALARSMPSIPVQPDELDTEALLLNAENGTIDLRTGELLKHRRENLITKLAPVPYDPDARAPRFLQFLSEIFEGDEELIAFVQRFAGYSLTGSTQERVFAILHGSGKNGKSTLVELLRDVMGDYARNTDTETILRKRYSGVGNDVAALKGARFVSAAEVEQGRALAESKVKNLTGRDTVTARFLFAEPFDFKPEFKLWLSTNNKPIIHGDDDAIWDRIRLIPFTQRFEGVRADAELPEKLRGEAAGVLAWMVRGCLEWQRQGLGQPERVRNATADYRSEMDVLAAFIEDRCVVHPNAKVGSTPLYNAYRDWCDGSGEDRMKQTKFSLRLKERGFRKKKVQTVTWYGIGLRDDRPDPDPDEGGSDLEGSGGDQGDQGGSEARNGSDTSSNPLRLEGSDSNPLNEEMPIDKGNSEGAAGDVRGFRPEINNSALETPREESFLENPLNPLNPLNHSSHRRLTAEEVEKIKRLIYEGMSAKHARAEVLGEDVAAS